MSAQDFILCIPFQVPNGMPKEVLKLNIRYIIVSLHSFYRSGNAQQACVMTNNKLVGAMVEQYALRSGNPVSVSMESFGTVYHRVGHPACKSNRLSARVAQFVGVHDEFRGQPFLHSEADILYLGKIGEEKLKGDMTFWGRTWQAPVHINDLASDTEHFFTAVGLDKIPNGERWLNAGIYYSAIDLGKYIKDIAPILFAHDLPSIIANKPAEEIFHNLVRWMGIAEVHLDDADLMNIVPTRIAMDIGNIEEISTLKIKSIHYTHGDRPHSHPDERTGGWETASAIWQYLLAEVDETVMNGSLQSVFRRSDVREQVSDFINL